jgi:branched-chain amino acid transport system ATP-binding protein
MLNVKEITAAYSGMEALRQASIYLSRGEFVALIGPNGAGKSTLLKSISGTVKCVSGEISFEDRDITKLEAHKRTKLGIIHIPEGRRVFPSLTVGENLELGGFRSEARPSAKENLKVVLEFFPVLKERYRQFAGTLSGGEQQMLVIGRGLMAMPRVLMLDEPSLGLSPLLTEHIFELIRDIRRRLQLSILLVEQRAIEALEICDRGYILETGRITLGGPRDLLMGNPEVQKAYLGTV